MDILAEIANKTIERITKKKQMIPLKTIRSQAEQLAKTKSDFPFEKALKADGMSFICEIKKVSPSKGVISKDFPYVDIAKDYQNAGAQAISCLTEPFYFKGSDTYLKQISKAVSVPILRKDFTVDEYMIYEAKIMGASAILLICSILDDKQLKSYMELADFLGLSVLTETHSAEEIERAKIAGARIIGVNNRNLKTFDVDIKNSNSLRELVPSDIIFVSESGIKSHEDIKILYGNGTDAVLIGETLMRAHNKKAMLEELRGGLI